MMSSRNRIQVRGEGPVQDSRAFSSMQAMKRFAKGGAHFVPMATPFICSKKRSWKRKEFLQMTILKNSFSIFLSLVFDGWCSEGGGRILCRTIWIATAWGIDV